MELITISQKIIGWIKSHSVFVFLFCTLAYSELVLRIFTGKYFFSWGLLFGTLFAAFAAGLYATAISFLKEKAAKIVVPVVLIVNLLNFATQIIYHRVFGRYLIWFSLVAGGADQVIGDGLLTATLLAILKGLPIIALLSLPIVLWFIKLRKVFSFEQSSLKRGLRHLAFCFAGYFASVGLIFAIPSPRELYQSAFDTNIAVNGFGLAAAEVLDFKYNILGVSQGAEFAEEETEQTLSGAVQYNVMDIDFNALANSTKDETLSSMDKYFAGQTPTAKNEYTGMFEGYNLITITAEGFSPYAVDKNLTPTLYKMMTEGFSFTNFYTPLWGVSTSDGEYAATTGLIPKSGVWSMYLSGANSMPFCFGNQFKKLGVDTRYAFHNHNFSFYHRDISHPNMGYKYLGVGNGLEKYITDLWPESDLEMMDSTVKMYSDADRFCAYYMTVSGHMNYTKAENAMAAKNWDKVAGLDVSDTLKAYYACNIELDRAMESLLKQLEESGKADKTLIVITPDHYPYGMESDSSEGQYKYLEELAGKKLETNFELYKSIFIIYSPSMTEPVTVSKYCSSIDIVPTVSNLLGLQYDSRLLMGKDVLSSSKGFVPFCDRSWITERGRYNANTKVYESFIGEDVNSKETLEYIKKTNALVNNKFKVSALILENNYYAHVLD